MFGGRSSGFLDFVQRESPTVNGTDFIPRRRYGDYLDAEVKRLLALARARRHDVNIIPFPVNAVVPERGSVTVFHGEESQRADAAVLALGSLPSQPLPGVDEEVVANGRYVVDPWSWQALPPSMSCCRCPGAGRRPVSRRCRGTECYPRRTFGWPPNRLATGWN
jgi:hypothetical protein